MSKTKIKPKKPATLFVELAPDMYREVSRLVREDAAKTGDPPIIARWIRQLLAREIGSRQR